MDLYTTTSYDVAKRLTERYSTSFSTSSTLLTKDLRPHIYAIYGMVRVADEIVDTYRGPDAAEQLERFYDEVIRVRAMDRPYSTNPIVHAFALTAVRYGIDKDLIDPFFNSMRMDLSIQKFDQKAFDTYIYGSAAVIGLMCLKVFVSGDKKRYTRLTPGAERLGLAYQKVNFLRDIGTDQVQLQRRYFPGVTELDEAERHAIIADIQQDFDVAKTYITQLPDTAKSAVLLSYRYYQALLDRLKITPVDELHTNRIRVPNIHKFALYLKARVKK